MKRLDFIFFDAGGGHRSAATALAVVVEQRRRPWQIRLVNLQEVLESADLVRRFTRLSLQDWYNLLLRKGWTLGSAQLLSVLHVLIRWRHPAIVRILQETWRDGQPDMVVSFVPHFNRALFESYRIAFPGRPLVTVLTDLADYPPHFWIERQEQFLVCGSARAAQQARELGHSAERVFRTSGMILQPRFYEAIRVDRGTERRRLGLQPDLVTGLVLFGGHGAGVMRKIVERLDEADLDLQLIVMCGKNERLAQELKQRRRGMPTYVEGFTREVPYYMHLSDFFIGKPGPGSISEALAMKLPVIVELNSWTLPQERYNVEWVRENGVGVVVPNFRRIASAVRQLLEPANFARYRSRAAEIENRAVFEIPEILARILEEARAPESEREGPPRHSGTGK
jgi:hypothetical protein